MLLVLYRLFNRLGDWPTFEQVDYELDHDGLGDGWGLLRAVPSGYISGSDFHVRPLESQQLHLTIGGFALVAGNNAEAATDLRVFCGTVVWAAGVAAETRPPELTNLNGTDLPKIIDLPLSGRSGVIARVGKLWAVNGQLWRQMNGSVTLGRLF